jgi:hypothetical protein
MKAAALGILAVAVLSSATVSAETIRFTNNEVNLGNIPRVNLTDQYAPFGLFFEDAYRYVDGRDPFADPGTEFRFGISNGTVEMAGRPSVFGTVRFANPTNVVEFDWWTGGAFRVNAFNSEGRLLASFNDPVGGVLWGTDRLRTSERIAHITFGALGVKSGGSVGISNLTFGDPAAIPEPSTLGLTVFALAEVARRSRRCRRAKQVHDTTWPVCRPRLTRARRFSGSMPLD